MIRRFFSDFVYRGFSNAGVESLYYTFFLRPKFIVYIGWGFRPSSKKVRFLAEKLNKPYWAIEDAFVRSFDLSEKSQLPFGLVLDKNGIYYWAKQRSDLEGWLNNDALSEEQLQRAQNCIALLQDKKVSKYNSIDRNLSAFIDVSQKYVLVVDQVKGDMSIEGALANESTFDQMLDDVLQAHPKKNILIKVHPDTLLGVVDSKSHNESRAGFRKKLGSKKQGCINLAKYQNHPRVTILAERVNPWDLFEVVDEVYTVSSQLGFEALLANKKVHCYGMPFYAGWGLTQDKISCERRAKKRSVEEVFYFAYIKYARYLNIWTKQQAELEDVIRWVADLRRHARLNQQNTLCVDFSPWKKSFLKDFLQLKSINQAKFVSFEKFKKSTIELNGRVVVWASNANKSAVEKGANNVVLMEDGFLRSVGLGVDLARPASLVLDEAGIYYDATQPSDLENILNNYEFSEFDVKRAEELIKSLLDARLSKYNIAGKVRAEHVKLPDDKKIILIPGQVENDASIQKGCVDIKTNRALIQEVRQLNPDAYLVYKSHPDVLKAGRPGNIEHTQVMQYVDLVVEQGSIIDWIERVDEVHTMTSLAGFEALLREKKVFTYGLPFYAGWGLAQDRHQCERRQRRLSLPELVAAALIFYPMYVDPVTKQVCSVETIVQRLKENLDKPHRPSLRTNIIRAVQHYRNR